MLQWRIQDDFSPTAIALGSSAIVKVSGQNVVAVGILFGLILHLVGAFNPFEKYARHVEQMHAGAR